MDALKKIGMALVSGLGGCLSGAPLGTFPAEEAVEGREDGPTEAAIVGVVVGPIVLLIVAIALSHALAL